MGFTLYIDLYHSTLYAKQDCAVPNLTGAIPGMRRMDTGENTQFYTQALHWSRKGSYPGGPITEYTTVAQAGQNTEFDPIFNASNQSSVYQNVDEVRPVNFSINYYIKY